MDNIQSLRYSGMDDFQKMLANIVAPSKTELAEPSAVVYNPKAMKTLKLKEDKRKLYKKYKELKADGYTTCQRNMLLKRDELGKEKIMANIHALVPAHN